MDLIAAAMMEARLGLWLEMKAVVVWDIQLELIWAALMVDN